LENAFENMKRRVNSSIETEGEHFEDLLFIIVNKAALRVFSSVSFAVNHKLKRLDMREKRILNLNLYVYITSNLHSESTDRICTVNVANLI
jgi:hypothetical protein